MTSSEFWLNFASNSLATILGLIIGIPIAFWIERALEKQRNKKQSLQNLEKIEDMLARALIQITNVELKLKALDNDVQHQYMIYSFFPEVELIETLHKELTELETNWDLLLSIDIVVSDFKSLNDLLAVNRELFSLKMGGKISTMSSYSKKLDDEFSFRKTIALDAIKDFRKIMFEKYPGFEKRFPDRTS
jgi:uncharacterized membrane-anchored protein YhcB (DUF1043 family)